MSEEYVTVRIAVAISPDGSWRAYGNSTWDDENTMDRASEFLDGNAAIAAGEHWVEAQIPLPKPQSIETIKGKVVE